MLYSNMRTLTLLALILLVGACNRIDSAFVEQLQSGISRANENHEAFEADKQKVRALFEKMEKAPQGLKNNPKFGYAELYGRVVQLNDAITSMIVNQNEMITKVEGIMADYTDGKLKKEEAQKEAELYLKNFEGYHGRIGRMQTIISDAEKAYSSMLTQWEALSEAEKIASANMPAPALPDATNLKGGSTLMSTGATPAPPGAQQPAAGALTPNGPTTPPQGTAPAAGAKQPGALAPTPQQQQTGTLSPTSPTSPGTLIPPKREQ